MHYQRQFQRRPVNNTNLKHFILFFICLLFIILFYFIYNLFFSSDDIPKSVSKVKNIELTGPENKFSSLEEYNNYFDTLLQLEQNSKLYSNSISNNFKTSKEIVKQITSYKEALNKFITRNTKLSPKMYNLILGITSESFYFTNTINKSWADDLDSEDESEIEDRNEINNIITKLQTQEKNNTSKALTNMLNPNKLISIIQGPPGTGKTTLSVECVIKLYTNYIVNNKNINHKILISASSNNAVDEIVKRCLIKNPDLPIIRVFSEYASVPPELEKNSLKYKIKELLNNTTEGKKLLNEYNYFIEKNINVPWYIKNEFNKIGNQILTQSSIIATTCTKTSDSVFDDIYFDTILIDECAQMIEPESLIPIIKGSPKLKLILIGDQKQLSPNVDSNIAKINGLDISLFERLIKLNYEYIMLNVQYRMYPFIASFSNINFYNNKLKSSEKTKLVPSYLFNFWKETTSKNAKDYLLTDDKFNGFNYIENLKPVLFLDYSIDNNGILDETAIEKNINDSYFNIKEVNTVINIVNLLLSKNIEPKQIGIITPYKAQIQAIYNELDKIVQSNSNEDSIKVNSVDNFQGQEKEYIIISMVRSSNKQTENKTPLGFVDDPKRINVALTRAKYGMFIVGNSDYLKSHDKYGILKNLVQYYSQQGCLLNVNDFIND